MRWWQLNPVTHAFWGLIERPLGSPLESIRDHHPLVLDICPTPDPYTDPANYTQYRGTTIPWSWVSVPLLTRTLTQQTIHRIAGPPSPGPGYLSHSWPIHWPSKLYTVSETTMPWSWISVPLLTRTLTQQTIHRIAGPPSPGPGYLSHSWPIHWPSKLYTVSETTMPWSWISVPLLTRTLTQQTIHRIAGPPSPGPGYLSHSWPVHWPSKLYTVSRDHHPLVLGICPTPDPYTDPANYTPYRGTTIPWSWVSVPLLTRTLTQQTIHRIAGPPSPGPGYLSHSWPVHWPSKLYTVSETTMPWSWISVPLLTRTLTQQTIHRIAGPPSPGPGYLSHSWPVHWPSRLYTVSRDHHALVLDICPTPDPYTDPAN